MQIGAHQPLGGDAMAAGAIEPKQPAAFLAGAAELKGLTAVGIGLGCRQHQQHRHDAGRCRHAHQGSDQAAAAFSGIRV